MSPPTERETRRRYLRWPVCLRHRSESTLDTAVTSDDHHPEQPWPFWAGLGDAAIDDALTLAQIGGGQSFVDLGCGDGRVMEAALLRGATATGVELDPGLARGARRRLAPWGDRARVIERSFFGGAFAADVVFAYLSPAVLQRLAPQLAAMPAGTRVVTASFPIPGWVPTEQAGAAWLYRLPAQPRSPRVIPQASWRSQGILCALPTRGEYLVTAEVDHPPGPITVSVQGAVGDYVRLRTGAEAVGRGGGRVAVDAVFAARPAGTVMTGALVAGAGTCELLCYHHPEAWGYWPLDAGLCEQVWARFASAGIGRS